MTGWARRARKAGGGSLVGLVGAGTALMLIAGGGPAAGADLQASRVDQGSPTFTDPTRITNPLFPKDRRTQVIQLGVEGEGTVRFEVTQLPDPRVISWEGRRIKTVVTHFVAYTNGRLVEVALDYYAQSDDGAVWYFGEDVDNYADGLLVDHDGTWLAGRDGPPGMIMPARPRVGDVYRPENIPGLVFEEATVTAVGLTVPGPRGPVKGAIRVSARLLDGTVEEKIFTPGYGEFEAVIASKAERYGVALAVPADARGGSLPQEVSGLTAGADRILDAAPGGHWDRIGITLRQMDRAWRSYQRLQVPPRLRSQLSTSLTALGDAVAARDPGATEQAAIDVGQACLDLQLIHRDRTAVDRARLALWRDQLAVDRAGGDPALAAGDLATIRAIQQRIDD